MPLYPKYQREMAKGKYSSIEEMCNQLGLNYDDVFDYSDLEDNDDKDTGSSRRRRKR